MIPLLQQNYFTHNNKFYLQIGGLMVGSTSSSFFTEIYLQHNESNNRLHIFNTFYVLGYFWYVSDILIIYNLNISNIYSVLTNLNNVNPKLSFCLELEQKKQNKFPRLHYN